MAPPRPMARRSLTAVAGGLLVLLGPLGAGAGAATTPTTTTFPTGTPRALAVGDVDGDGDQDVVAGASGIKVLRNDGAGVFTTLTSAGGSSAPSVALHDLDRDGDLDAAFPNAVHLGLGNGSFGTALPTGITATATSYVAAADLTEDGAPDLAVTDTAGSRVHLLVGRGDGTFTTGPAASVSNPAGVDAADLDGDGHLDLAVASNGRGASVLYGAGDGSFTRSSAVTMGCLCLDIDVVDLDGDGLLDLVVSDGPEYRGFGAHSAVIPLRGRPDGTFVQGQSVSVPGVPFGVARGDMNGDGDPDVAVSTSNDLYVLPGLGNGELGAPGKVGPGNMGVAAGDLDGGGPQDVVGGSSRTSSVSVHLLRDAGPPVPTSTSLEPIANPVQVGHQVELRSIVTAFSSSFDVLRGDVVFRDVDAGVEVGRVPVTHLPGQSRGQASLFTSDLPLGDRRISASFEGSSGFAASSHTATAHVRTEIQAPNVYMRWPADLHFAQGQVFLVDYGCFDEPGGSGIAYCQGDVHMPEFGPGTPVGVGEPLDTAEPGRHTFHVHFRDNAGNEGYGVWQYYVVEPETTTGSGSVTTDAEGDGPTNEDPVETGVASPVAGSITVTEGITDQPAPTGFTFLNQQINITAPTASAASPLQLTFLLDHNALPGTEDEQTLQVFRNGTLVPACSSATAADPDPCLASRGRTVDNDVRLVVRTSRASAWNLGTTPARPPVASAGADRTVASRAEFSLDASSSRDPDGGALAYRWSQVSGPPAVLRDDRTAQLRASGVTGPATVVFRVVVTDATGLTAVDEVTVTVRASSK